MLYPLGLLLYVEQPDEAVGLMEQAAKAEPALQEGLVGLKGALYMAQKNNSPAYRRVVLGRALAAMDNWDLAQLAFTRATQLDAGYAEAWAFLGEARWRLGLDGKAELERARALNPDSVLTQALLALRLRRRAQAEQALGYLQRVTKREPDRAVWQIEIGNTLTELGKLPQALPYYQHAVELEPQNAETWSTLARFCLLYHMEPRSLGLPAARQALLLAPNDPRQLDLMGWVMLNLGDLTSGERFLQQALQNDSTFAAAHLHLGQLYLQSGNNQGALVQLSAAKSLAGKEADRSGKSPAAFWIVTSAEIERRAGGVREAGVV